MMQRPLIESPLGYINYDSMRKSFVLIK